MLAQRVLPLSAALASSKRKERARAACTQHNGPARPAQRAGAASTTGRRGQHNGPARPAQRAGAASTTGRRGQHNGPARPPTDIAAVEM
jgi:hypothetical protein